MTGNCRHCGQAINGQDYFVAGIEMDARNLPTNVLVHQGCRAGFVIAETRRERLASVTLREVQYA